MSKVQVFQTVRLKGRVTADAVVAATALDAEKVERILADGVSAGDLLSVRDQFRLTPTGRETLNAELTSERATVDQVALARQYEDFDAFNSAFKQLVTDWQLVDAETPNLHEDAAYDEAIVDRLVTLDAGFQSWLAETVEVAPRLAPYPARFGNALDRAVGGDHAWIARPVIDSYHTVWFELHEELIGLRGLSRAEEAAAGRAE